LKSYEAAALSTPHLTPKSSINRVSDAIDVSDAHDVNDVSAVNDVSDRCE